MIAGPINVCERCGVQLLAGREVWLELNAMTGMYSKPGDEPIEHSQGLFSFGAGCAKLELKRGIAMNERRGTDRRGGERRSQEEWQAVLARMNYAERCLELYIAGEFRKAGIDVDDETA